MTPSAQPELRPWENIISQHSRRHSASSITSKPEVAGLMIQRPSSCVTKTPQGGLSVVATEVIENRINPLDSILESSVSPTKRYFSIRTNPLLPFVSTQNAPKKRDIFGGLREKLGLGKTHKSQSTRDKTFEKICFELARADESEAGSENAQMFEMDELALKINIIDGKSFNLVLPPAMDVLASCDVDTEEGVGGSCDLFIGMLPNSCKKVSEKASPLGLVPKLLPHGVISKEARYVGSCFWIWLCIVDDLTENLVGKEWEDAEADLFMAFSKNTDESMFNNKDDDAVRVSVALRNVIHSTNICTGLVDSSKESAWREAFMQAVCEVLVGFREERPLLDGNRISMFSWMRLRAITISVRPFLILARADLGLNPTVSPLGNPLDRDYRDIIASNDGSKVSDLRKVECMLQLILGLQNDILGWEKDFKTSNPLSAIQVLIGHGAKYSTAMSRVINTHNELVRRCVQHAQLVCKEPSELLEQLDADGISPGNRRSKPREHRPSVFSVFRNTPVIVGGVKTADKENIRRYVQLILGFANGMAMWMAISKRYMA